MQLRPGAAPVAGALAALLGLGAVALDGRIAGADSAAPAPAATAAPATSSPASAAPPIAPAPAPKAAKKKPGKKAALKKSELAIIDPADPLTEVRGLARALAAMKIPFTDLSKDVVKGKVSLGGARALFIGTYVESLPEARDALAAAAPALQAFVAGGGVLVVLAQADEVGPASAYLPAGLRARRGDFDYDAPRLLAAKHPLFAGLRAEDLAAWEVDAGAFEYATGYRGVYDAFDDVAGFAPLAARDAAGAYPAVLEAAAGAGRVVLCQLAPDEVAAAPANPDHAKAARTLLRNLVDYAAAVAAGGPDAPPPPAPAAPWKAAAARLKIRVFEDTDGDGTLDPGEPPLPGIAVTVARDLLVTSADGTASADVPGGSVARVASVEPPATHEPSTPWFARVAGGGEVRFGLRRRATPPPETFSVVQVSDVHIGAHAALADAAELRARVAELNALDPRPAFVLSTGDVTAAAKTSEFSLYRDGMTALALPLFTSCGNHDRLKGPEHWDGFEREIGPVVFGFDYGPYHFATAYEAFPGSEVFDWLAKDLKRAAAAHRPSVVFMHHYPRRELLDALAGKGVVAIVTGDWHGNKVERYKGILSINTGTLLVGGIDLSPASFRLIHFGTGGAVASELRYVRATERLSIVSPPETAAAAAELPLVASAYDTVHPPTRVTWRVVPADTVPGVTPRLSLAPALAAVGAGAGGVEVTVADAPGAPGAGAVAAAATVAAAAASDTLTGELRRTSAWSWSTALPDLAPGRYYVEVTAWAGADAHAHWTASRKVTLTKAAAPRPAPGSGAPWPMFRRDAARSGVAAAAVAPPLALAWVLPTGSSIGLASPVVAGGQVFLALEDRATVDTTTAGLVAADAVTGAVHWRFSTPTSVLLSAAVSGDTVVFQEVDGTVHALDTATGEERWRFRLDDAVPPVWTSHWVSAAPLIDGNVVWAGYAPAPVALDLRSGKVLWVGKPHGREAFTNYASMTLADVSETDAAGAGVSAERVLLLPSLHDGLRVLGLKPGPASAAPKPAVLWSGKTRHRVGATPAYADGVAYYPGGKHLVAVDVLTGKPRWRTELPAGWHVSSPLVAGGRVYAASARGTLVSLDAASGAIRWETTVGPSLLDLLPYRRGYAGLSSSPALAGDHLYIGGDDGYLYAVDAESGRVAWRYHLGTPVSSSPAVAGNAVYVAALDGNLYCFVGRR
ncbi:MAG TPA: PQQ-binding-like beta-propeller repeat protein [Myxococcota bacterium]|jgi:outer membrane protein assembly factor BamB|nr:PQQ-binding-like beta-propeller repeat protein [Myxococcota bacterium]